MDQRKKVNAVKNVERPKLTELNATQKQIIEVRLPKLMQWLDTFREECRKAELHQIAAVVRHSSSALEDVGISQVKEIRADGLPDNWSNEDKVAYLHGEPKLFN